MRWFKYIVLSLVGLLVAAVVIPLALVLLLDQGQLRDLLVYAVNNTTDYQLEINGPLELDLSRSPSLGVSDIRFSMPADGFELRSETIHTQIDLRPLLSGHLVIREFMARNSTVNMTATPDEEDGAGGLQQADVPAIEKVDIENLVVNYRQPDETEPLHVKLDSLRVQHPAGSDAITLTGGGAIDGTAFHLAGEFGAINTLLTSDQPWPASFRFDVMDTVIHAEGQITSPHRNPDLDIALQVDVPDLQGLLHLLHHEAPAVGSLTATGRLSGAPLAPRLTDLELAVTHDKDQFRLSGTVENVLTFGGVDLVYSGSVRDQGILEWILPPDVSPRFKSVHSSGRLSGSPGALLLDDFRLDASNPNGHRVKLDGLARIVDAPQPLRDLQATVSIEAPDTGFLVIHIDGMPVVGPLTLTARVASDEAVLVFKDIKLSAGKRQAVLFKAQGDIRHVSFTPALNVSGVNLQAGLEGKSARAIGDLIGVHMPDIGPVKVSARYTGSMAASVLKDLKIRAGDPQQLQLEGIGEIRLAGLTGTDPLAGVELDMNVQAPRTTALSGITGMKVRNFGRLTGKAHVSSGSGVPGITGLTVRVRQGDDLQLDLSGTLADLQQMSGIDMKLELAARDLNTLGKAFDTPLPAEGRVKFGGRLRGSLEQLRLTGRGNLRNSLIEADLTGAFAGKRPAIKGAITIPDLDVHDLGYYPGKVVAKTPASTSGVDEYDEHLKSFGGQRQESKPVRTTPLFSREPIDLSALRTVDLDLELAISKLSSFNADTRNIFGRVHLDNGKLDLKPLRISVDDNVININAGIDAGAKAPTVALQTSADDVDIGLLTRDPDTKKSRIRGTMSSASDLHTRGRSPAELAAGLDGHIYMLAENAKARRSDMNLLNLDVIGFVISNILSPKQDVNIDCAIFSMDFTKGHGQTDLFIIDTRSSLVRIDAAVNLADETLDVAILPQYKVKLFKKKKPIKIYGPIADPVYEVTTLADLTRETTRATLLAPLTVSKGLLDKVASIFIGPGEDKGSCDEYL